ncbi:hypothetical protein AYL99_10310 [Fonsecaea erecta]|uniref:Apple domain-containing protein n=1 Tax=Fonsecaea erecta TaxID=1367422 RepID=A0A178Z6F7_9EURO|nr:hypothetical protein AYL99_10310 [Fonsecaea erecta]OAP55337.1 hypothetical protein AYL99_10310 [Fonsecaea erecta]
MATVDGLWNTATTWSTIYNPCTVTLTSTTTKTLTPAASTSTTTITSTATTTLSTSFSVITQTSTTTTTSDTTTITSATTTTTTTVTSSSSTSTVAAPATFTPIQTSLPGSTYSGSGGSDPVSKREAKPGPGPRPGRQNQPGSQGGFSQWRHPQGVTCQIWVPGTCSTTVTTVTSTVTGTATTVTSTSTTTTTITSAPVGVTTTTTTVTATSVSTITDTSTSTSTSTTTTYLSTTTVYAACATNNFADEYQGEPLVEYTGGYSTVSDVTVDTAYDCCVAAITLGNSAIWAFIIGPGAGTCEVGQTDDSCPEPSTNPSTGYYETTGAPTVVGGNSYCGEVNAAVPVFSSSSSS